MRKPSKMAASVAVTSSLAILFAMSSFADSRPHQVTQHESHSSSQSSHGSSSRSSGNDASHSFHSTPPSHSNETYHGGQTNRSYGTSHETNRGYGTNRGVNRETNRGYGVNRDGNRGYGTNRETNRETNRGYGVNRDGNRGYGTNRETNRGYPTNRETNRGYSNDRYANRGFTDRSNRSSQFRTDDRGWRGNSFRNSGHPAYRENGRVSVDGHVRRFNRERGGYRVWLDWDDYSFWVPEAYFLNRGLRLGLGLHVGGIFRDGFVAVDALDWLGEPYYSEPYYSDAYNGPRPSAGYLSGTVERVDYQNGTILLRDDATGQLLTVDGRAIDRRSSQFDLPDLRPGDRVTVTGQWLNGRVFSALEIMGAG